ncbi:unnamed protein product [Caenorhabditis angaria]|uniref:Uncharacterized protein n=1 Tax=Caenorhabditis angaria TaxID=860376 RepID=A0A9P1IFH3_9PELO|nr:unnamed protein product [Caenorhabditis angaria]
MQHQRNFFRYQMDEEFRTRKGEIIRMRTINVAGFTAGFRFRINSRRQIDCDGKHGQEEEEHFEKPKKSRNRGNYI